MPHTAAFYDWNTRLDTLFPALKPHHRDALAHYSFGMILARCCGLTAVVTHEARSRFVDDLAQVWSADITCVPMPSGFVYLAATIDWFSRWVVSWKLSNTLDGWFCQEMLEEALGRGTPEVFNTDQACSSRRERGRRASKRRA